MYGGCVLSTEQSEAPPKAAADLCRSEWRRGSRVGCSGRSGGAGAAGAVQGLRARGRLLGRGVSRPPGASALRCARREGGAAERCGRRCGGWQDSRVVHDSRGPCSEGGPFLARYPRGASPNGDLRGFSDTWRAYPAKASSFWIHGGDMLPRTVDFPVRGPFWDAWSEKIATNCRLRTHQDKILPLPVGRERISRISCHCRTPGNAFREHFAIGERWGTHQGIILLRIVQGCQASAQPNHLKRPGLEFGRFSVVGPLRGPLALLM